MPTSSTSVGPLAPDSLRRHCDAAAFAFESTAELAPVDEPPGQQRALEALRFAIGMRRPGYNLFVVGPSGVGKHGLVRKLLARAAQSSEPAPDYCYIHDFERPHVPRALRLPSGRGAGLVTDMMRLIEELRAAIPAAFESEQYQARMRQIEEQLKAHPEQVFREVAEEAARRGIAMVRLPSGVAFAPLKGGEVLAPAEFERLPEPERARAQQQIEELQKQLQKGLEQLPQWVKEAREKAKVVSRETTLICVGHSMADLEQRYADLPEVLVYLRAVRADVVEHVDDFKKTEDGHSMLEELGNGHFLDRYTVNLLVDSASSHGAPVVYEDRPASDRLLGHIDHRIRFGNMISDFTLIKAGALHRANGGYLVLDARKVLSYPHAWETLKRALFSSEVRIESLGQLLGFSGSPGIEPEPIPIDVKVVLIGDPLVYHLMNEFDPDVKDLFRVLADFSEDVERTAQTELEYARWLATIAREQQLRPLDRAAAGLLVEQGSRLAGDASRLSMNLRSLTELLEGADHGAAQRGAECITARDVDSAIQAGVRMRDRVRSRVNDTILRGTVLIDTSGEKVGQVNGLAVHEFSGFMFGRPTRVTATAHTGDGKVVDIEREVELGGALHSKGVLILSSYLAARYTRGFPLSLSGSLVFEQSYAPVEGDSASLAELCAMLSVLAGAPVKQSFAVTGSVNQYGQVQAIGAVNEKIEGFFDICKARGLTGEHAVLIPAANSNHLMLREDVVQACREGAFAVYAVENVDTAIELLTGVSPGSEDAEGNFPEGSLNARVMEQLVEFAVVAEGFAKMLKVESPPEATAR